MRLIICAVADSKAEIFMEPMFFQAEGQAIRAFADAVNGSEGNFALHPEDFTLFVVGEFDQALGVITPTENKLLANGASLKMELPASA